MNRPLHDAMVELLMEDTAEHMSRGLGRDQALQLSAQEMMKQLRGSRLGLAERLIAYAVRQVLEAHRYGTMH